MCYVHMSSENGLSFTDFPDKKKHARSFTVALNVFLLVFFSPHKANSVTLTHEEATVSLSS